MPQQVEAKGLRAATAVNRGSRQFPFTSDVTDASGARNDECYGILNI